MSRRQQRRRTLRRRTHMAVAGGGLAAVASLATGGVAQAQSTFTVTNLNDSGAGSLRAAIASVNADTTDTAAPGDSIVFQNGLTGAIALSTTAATGDSLEAYRPVQITGPGASELTIQAAPASRIFDFTTTSGVTDMAETVSGLTLTGGAPALGNGGAVYSEDGGLTLDSDAITGSTSTGTGGGVMVHDNPLTISGSTISGNRTTADEGGGAYDDDATTTVTGSTISDNTSGSDGGGIGAFFFSTVNVTDSTISGNTAADDGGGVYSGTASITNSTITANTAESGAGFAGKYGGTVTDSTVAANTIASGGAGGQIAPDEDSASVTLQDSIVSGTGSVPDVVLPSGASGTASYSLIRDPSAPSGSYTPITTNSSDILNKDPELAPLAANGGPTETMVPEPTSPVLDQGKAFGQTTDQRGFPRPFVLPTITSVPGDHSDIGAVEAETPSVAAIAPSSGSAGTRVGITGTGFTGATEVLFGSTPASSFAVVNDTTVVAVAPSNAGTQDVRVVTPLGESPVVGADKFVFPTAPTFTPTVSKPHSKLSGSKVGTGIKVSCPAGGFSCSGSFKATAFVKHHKTKLAGGSISLSAGQSKTISFKLGSKALKQLKSAGKLKITIQITIADGSGTPIKVNRTITLHHKVKHKKKH